MWFTVTLLKNYNVSPGNKVDACDGREEELANKNWPQLTQEAVSIVDHYNDRGMTCGAT